MSASNQTEITVVPDRPLLIFGGPYSNLAATLAMRRKAEALGIEPDQTICTGDVVAYCAEPEATATIVRDWGCRVIKGNCEESLSIRAPDCGCGFDEGTACDRLSKGWYPYADSRISDASREWMAALPAHLTFTLAGRRIRVIHGGVTETSHFIFASTPASEKQAELDDVGADIIIAGHCGIPFVQKIGAAVWFNPGVIGMPANDGTSDGWYGLIEPFEGGLRFSICRLPYDAREAAATLRQAGSAPAYAEALTTGVWPSLDALPMTERDETGNPLRIKPLYINAKQASSQKLADASQLRQPG
jgi:predicted phosphodiesterase